MNKEVALNWMAVQIDRTRIDTSFLTKSVMPLFNATTASGISDWPFYAIGRQPHTFRIWFSLADPQLIPLLRPAIEEHFQPWLESKLDERQLFLHYGQPRELLDATGPKRDSLLRLLHLISETCLRAMHLHRNQWDALQGMRTALSMQLILLKAFAQVPAEAICMAEQFFRKEVKDCTPDWHHLSRMQQLETIARWRKKLHRAHAAHKALLMHYAVQQWSFPEQQHERPLIKFATIAPVLTQALKRAYASTSAPPGCGPEETLPHPSSWEVLHVLFRQIHNNLLLHETNALWAYTLMPESIQQATSSMS